MLKTAATVPEELDLILSNLSPGPVQKRLALAVVLGIFVAFVLVTVGVLAGMHSRRLDTFMTAYLTGMFVCDSITAVLLFAQFSILRLRATLVIASGYLFRRLS
jgi:ABC-type dipeptide/oligopeptide/nickel transport system permease subunit